MALTDEFVEHIYSRMPDKQRVFSPYWEGVLDQWDEYFMRIGIKDAAQCDEFDSIMLSRRQTTHDGDLTAPVDELNSLGSALFEPLSQFTARYEDSDGQERLNALFAAFLRWHRANK